MLANPQKREFGIDVARGALLVVMTIDHLPSSLVHWLYEALGFVTAAEGFVFVSGFVAGSVYYRFYEEKGYAFVWQRSRRRALLIYSYHLAVFGILYPIVNFSTINSAYAKSWEPLLSDDKWLSVVSVCALLYQPLSLDVLPMYCLFILLVPVVVRQVAEGRGLYVLMVSSSLWVLAQFGIRNLLTGHQLGGLPVNLGNFDIFAWQFLFVVAAYAGILRYSSKGHQFDGSYKVVILLAFGLSVLLFLWKHRFITVLEFVDRLPGMNNRTLLSPLRALNVASLVLVTGFVLRFVKPNVVTNWLSFLGKQSLQVFTFQIVLAYCVNLLSNQFSVSKWFQIVIVAVCVASLSLPAWISSRKTKTTAVSDARRVT